MPHQSRHCTSFVRVALLMAAFILVSPQTFASEMGPGKDEDAGPKWTPLFRGIDRCDVTHKPPSSLALHAARIELEAPGIGLVTTPSNGEAPGETNAMRPSIFLVSQKCQLAINASPFDPVAQNAGEPQEILGLSISDGELVSKPHPTYESLIVTKNRKARVVTPPYPTDNIECGIGGFSTILAGGELKGDEGDRHPRTAAGVSKDGKFLYLLVIDGRQIGYSMGASTRETAEWMAWLGAYDALNLDGGGSTTMVIEDKEKGALVVNRPIHNGIPGQERFVGNCLGVFAQALP
jgi:hypothetical protein